MADGLGARRARRLRHSAVARRSVRRLDGHLGELGHGPPARRVAGSAVLDTVVPRRGPGLPRLLQLAPGLSVGSMDAGLSYQPENQGQARGFLFSVLGS